ncbi:hypothetical protein [Pseudomonas vancouverensis]|uniref:Uncharacterized protein n=1 Tax=Pseudomonas vancouverensis TaxID=95300 RepID=A0A1H2PJP1_PSEVA|nr:hypothetical protein [Pseudomonas vancouverensis]KAB0492612.1 hypothetical protein F7R09_23450 [Pseudomonas vancouverensis]TDB58438.1 hypothetical protein EIY72_23120 [Pseudomonas vancouverensis]SDV17206.1 hypothetical protein SAMN05216558_5872 [Pseudomonas vancouverensis]
MNNLIENSFIATLRMRDHNINLLELLHEKPALATIHLFSGGFFTGASQTFDHSHLLGIRPAQQGGSAHPLKLHFRYTGNGYVLSIKNSGAYYNKLISECWRNILGAVNSDEDNPTTFTLLDHHGKPITLSKIISTHTPVSLVTEDDKYVGGETAKGSPYVYLARTKERSKITFALSILERKVPHANS